MKKEILSSENKKGKMAIRVYPPWEKNLNNTALKTQKWQEEYFIDLRNNIDKNKILKLYFK